MKRREFLNAAVFSASASILPSACSWWHAPGPVTYPAPIASLVDAHCHLFNGSDLPSERFLKIVILHAYPKEAPQKALDIEDPDLLDGLVTLLIGLVEGTHTPTAAAEVRILDKEERPRPENTASPANENAVLNALGEMVTRGGIAVSESAKPSAVRKMREAIFTAAGESGLGVSDAKLSAAEGRAIGEKAYRSKYDLGRLLRWFALFTRYRHVLAEELSSDYRLQGFQPALLCPALIDYDYWLGQFLTGPTESSLPEQVEVMGRVARRTKGPVVHGYVAFDPLRQAAADAGEATSFDPLGLVRTAIHEEGFLGVKLYPPMGFRASGNGTAASQTYPCRDVILKLAASDGAVLHASCKTDEPIEGKVVGRKLDAALSKLFELCAADGVCVMAHANNSNGSNKNYGERADPAYWIDVFKRWPTLHVMLAHFGHFNSVSDTGTTPPVGCPSLECPETSWEWTLGRYIQSSPNAPVFTDLSYFSEIAGKATDALSAYGGVIKAWINQFDPNCFHLIYGSDWIMLGVDPDYGSYAARVHDFFRNVVGLDHERMERVFRSNAGRFLGLTEGSKARDRLVGFYERHSIPLSRLPVFSNA